MSEFVTVETNTDGVATIRLDRPPVNALSPEVWEQLGAAARRCAEDDAVGAVVVTGGPKVFAAGADIREMSQVPFTQQFKDAGRLQEAVAALARLPKVTVAAIAGYALGGGCEVALACDFRVAADSAKLGQPEIQLGLIPGAGGTQRLARLVGVQQAKRLVYSGDMVTAEEACEIGLVDRVVEAEELQEAADAEAGRYAHGPYALRMAKRAIDEGVEQDLDSALRLESSLFAATFATEDAQIGMRSFLEHGPGQARFTGR
ncbi:enoyl-CoA hydratase/isomerase family protein [Egibacter rhizosphaerae]|uniref:enoyl-CoA hydratase n=1 Tax=Egibacter rhizosphaerae TaxID=1670831 RepID=A0A411YCY9_9ACTN|nr:enoyl-CoA hydratase/isomerase family protein [Egibacter rhizosphaerae]QBI19058.1 enoyl-CoA hydratase/isomerase family protein [Egibacter rhizosphaerae]